MYTIIDEKNNNVLYTSLNLEQMKAQKRIDRHFLQTSEYDTTPKIGSMKLDTEIHDFVYMTWDEVKRYRGEILANSDWRDLPSYAGDDQEEWRTYRQELRDLPQDYAEVEDIVFPTEP